MCAGDGSVLFASFALPTAKTIADIVAWGGFTVSYTLPFCQDDSKWMLKLFNLGWSALYVVGWDIRGLLLVASSTCAILCACIDYCLLILVGHLGPFVVIPGPNGTIRHVKTLVLQTAVVLVVALPTRVLLKMFGTIGIGAGDFPGWLLIGKFGNQGCHMICTLSESNPFNSWTDLKCANVIL